MRRLFSAATFFAIAQTAFAAGLSAKCAEIAPFLTVARNEAVRVYRVRIEGHKQGAVKCPGGGTCYPGFLVAGVTILANFDRFNTVGPALLMGEGGPEGFEIRTLDVGAEYYVVVFPLPSDMGADAAVPGCANAALRVSDGSVIGFVRQSGFQEAWSIERLETEIRAQRR